MVAGDTCSPYCNCFQTLLYCRGHRQVKRVFVVHMELTTRGDANQIVQCANAPHCINSEKIDGHFALSIGLAGMFLAR